MTSEQKRPIEIQAKYVKTDQYKKLVFTVVDKHADTLRGLRSSIQRAFPELSFHPIFVSDKGWISVTIENTYRQIYEPNSIYNLKINVVKRESQSGRAYLTVIFREVPKLVKLSVDTDNIVF